MAAEVLRDRGVADPRAQLAVVRGTGLATLLLARRPFTPADLATLESLRGRYGFELVLPPGAGSTQPALVSAADDLNFPQRPEFADVNVHKPTDDQPFFFHSYRLSNLFHPSSWGSVGSSACDKDAISILIGLVLFVTVLRMGVVVVPLVRERRRSTVNLGGAEFETVGFFVAIGVAFMLFEAAQMQLLFMGTAFPLGLRLGQQLSSMSLAWYWAVNGMASTCAVVYGIALSILHGFTLTYWVRFAGYGVAAALATRLVRRLHQSVTVASQVLHRQEA